MLFLFCNDTLLNVAIFSQIPHKFYLFPLTCLIRIGTKSIASTLCSPTLPTTTVVTPFSEKVVNELDEEVEQGSGLDDVNLSEKVKKSVQFEGIDEDDKQRFVELLVCVVVIIFFLCGGVSSLICSKLTD